MYMLFKMKIVIIEGTDNVGKDTIINRLNTDFNCNIFHCEKPPVSIEDAAEYQEKYFNRLKNLTIAEYKSKMFDCLIHNRSWYGEYVYGCMYRNNNSEDVIKLINKLEYFLLEDVNFNDICYITLLSDNMEFLSRNEDGLSLSSGKEDLIKEETERFKSIFEHSIIPNKHIVYVNNGNKFRDKDDIYNEILSYIK